MFHKSAAKRSHIRIPVLNMSSFSASLTSLSQLQEGSPQSNPLKSSPDSNMNESVGSKAYLQWTPLLKEVKFSYYSVLSTIKALHGMASSVLNSKEMLLWKEMISCLTLNVVLNLMEDRKVSDFIIFF